MDNSSYIVQMWQQMTLLQLLIAPVCGVVVGVVYFQSLRWSLNQLEKTKHKIRLFVGVAVLRILLFFGVLVLIAQHNPVVVILYVAAFFLTKTAVVTYEKGQIIKFDKEKKTNENA